MQAVILAAGASSRFSPFGQTTHKSMVSICGKPLLSWTIQSLKEAGIKDIVTVAGVNDGKMHTFLESQTSKIALQKEPLGMGDALLAAREHLNEEFLVLFPYMVNAAELVKPLLTKGKADSVLLVDETEEPWKYGILSLSGSRAVGIVEKPAKGKEPSKTKVSGIYLFKKGFLDVLGKTRKHMYQFEEALDSFMKVWTVETVNGESRLTLKYPWDLFAIRDWLLESLPEKRSKKAKIAKTATLEGKVIVEDGAQIFDYASIQGPVYIGSSAVVGAYSILRDHSDLEQGAEIQRYVDCTRSIIGPDSQIHTGFVGDSILGSGIRIGAGLTVANRRVDRKNVEVEVGGKKVDTGRTYMGVLIGDDVKVGVNATFMPGVVIGDGCLIGPNSVVFENVQPRTLFYTDYKKAQLVKKLQ